MTAPETTSAPLIINLFGPLQILVDGHPLPRLRSRKGLWLLALLTLRHRRPVEREWLAGTLWPDMEQSQAFANLRPILSELRSGLGSQQERLQSPERSTLLLDLTGAKVDVLAFDAAIASARLSEWEQATALYRGHLLEGCTEEWVFQERSVREHQCLQALQKLANTALTAGDYGKSIGYYQRASVLDPWGDSVRRGWMEALARSGDRNAALQVYREFVEVLRDDPNAVPDEQTTALYVRLRAEARTQNRAHAVVAAEPMATPKVEGYLPHALTDLIGREDECLEVASRLRRSRLVTLTGLGGIGKTRLALAVAGAVAREYADGVWLVALDALAESKQVVPQIASVLGVKEEGGCTPLESVTRHLHTKRVLLVLDNCEHLLEASAQVVGHLLRECGELRILATSREALEITGETAWTVPSLAVPDPAHLPQGQATLLRVLMSYESIQLFVERAQAVRKTFALTGGNARIVAQVCSRLEGIPLAIELAAARVKAMTVEQIASRLDDYLGLLTGGSTTAQSRQQTLRSTLDWSYALLSEAERLLLKRMSVFAGGWTLEAAEQVGSGEGVLASQVLNLLTSLVDKSVVIFEERGQAEGRYRLLEMVRQYAAERLQASGETERSRSRHRDFYLVLAGEAAPNLKGAEQPYWMQCLDAEIDNLRAAQAWCGAEKNGAKAGLQLAEALWQFWELRGHFSEGRTSLLEALSRDGAQERTATRAGALYAAGVFAFYHGEYEAVRTLCAEALAIFKEIDNKQGIARTLKDLGRVAGAQGDYETARVFYREGLAISQELGDMQGSSWLLNDLGNLCSVQGDYEAAKRVHAESLEISRNLGDTEGIAWALHHQGGVASSQEDYKAAQVFHLESLATFQSLGNKQGMAWALHYLGNVADAQGNYEEARTWLEEGLALFRELGNKQGTAWSLHEIAKVVSAQGDSHTAKIFQKESIRIQRDLGDRRGVAAGLRGLVILMPPTERKAAVLWGAAEALRESIGVPLPPREREVCDRWVSQVVAELGEHDFFAAYEEGRTLHLEQAADSALEEARTSLSASGIFLRDNSSANLQQPHPSR